MAKSVLTVARREPAVKSVSITCSETPGGVLTVINLSWPRVYVTIKGVTIKGDTPNVLIPREQMLEFCRAVIMAIVDTPVDEGAE